MAVDAAHAKDPQLAAAGFLLCHRTHKWLGAKSRGVSADPPPLNHALPLLKSRLIELIHYAAICAGEIARAGPDPSAALVDLFQQVPAKSRCMMLRFSTRGSKLQPDDIVRKLVSLGLKDRSSSVRIFATELIEASCSSEFLQPLQEAIRTEGDAGNRQFMVRVESLIIRGYFLETKEHVGIRDISIKLPEDTIAQSTGVPTKVFEQFPIEEIVKRVTAKRRDNKSPEAAWFDSVMDEWHRDFQASKFAPSSPTYRMIDNDCMTERLRASRRRYASAMTQRMPLLLLLGSGELGKEVAISAKRLGCRICAADSYPEAPAMQVADASEVLNMLDGDALEAVIRKHAALAQSQGRAFFVVPEVEAIRTERLLKVEEDGINVVPSARAADLTMNRDAIRALAAETLKLPTARYGYAESAAELHTQITGKSGTKFPCVVKPVMSSSGKGQSVIRKEADIDSAWGYAVANMRGDTKRVIVEEFIDFDYEITLLTIRQRPTVGGKKLKEKDRTLFVNPIGHRQERGDYQESWMPCAMKPSLIKKAQKMAAAITREIAGVDGAGLFGVEFFIKGTKVIFSELSPRPHDTGMVTMISQDLSEFDLHVRAILGLPIAKINYVKGAAASAVILSTIESTGEPAFTGLDAALAMKNVQIRLFGKPSTRKYRRMGVALATANTVTKARSLAMKASARVSVIEAEPPTA